jgi:hypothetical protein
MVGCSAESPCTGRLTLSVSGAGGAAGASSAGSRGIVVGSTRYRVASGRWKLVRVKVSRRFRRLLHHRRLLVVTAKPRGGGRTASRSFRLKK